jgi:amidase
MDVDGVPVSLKDQFDIAGTELTQGYVAYLGSVFNRFRFPGPLL